MTAAWLPVLVPAGGAVVVAAYRRGALAAWLGALTTAVALLAAAEASHASLGWGGQLRLTADVQGVARLVVVLVPLVATAVLAYAAAAHRDDRGRARLLSLLLAFVAGMQLLVTAGDFLTLLIGWEVVAACSWALIGHRWEESRAVRSAGEAYLATRVGDLGLFVAAGAALAGAGTLSFGSVEGLGEPYASIVAAGVLVAAAAKSAQLPFAPWLFSAMAGPAAVSALLHSAAMVAAGAYLVLRLAPSLDAVTWFLPAVSAVGVTASLAGGVVALVQPDIKRALAASTTAQYGLVFVAAGAGSTAAGALHLAAHAGFKSLLFLGAGVAAAAAGTGALEEMRLGRALPATATLFGVGVLALVAVPPLGGAFSKEEVFAAATHRAGWLGWVVLAAGALSALYGARLYALAFGEGPVGVLRRPGPTEHLAMAGLAGGSLALGAIALPPVRRFVMDVSGGRLFPRTGLEAVVSLAVVAGGVVAVWRLDRRVSLGSLGLPAGARAAVADWLSLPVAARALVVGPVLALARALARLDDRVIDAGVRLVGRIAEGFARLTAWWAERGVDGVVESVGAVGLAGARSSRRVDERVVDGAAEGLARGIGAAGARSRLVQTGLAHHYYVLAAVGVVGAVAAAALAR